MGPLALGGLIGLKVRLVIMGVLHDEFGDPKYRLHPHLQKMVRAGQLGCETGAGFYSHTKGPATSMHCQCNPDSACGAGIRTAWGSLYGSPRSFT